MGSWTFGTVQGSLNRPVPASLIASAESPGEKPVVILTQMTLQQKKES